MTAKPTNDPSEFARLLVSAQPHIYAYVRSLIFNPSDADDILQEVAAVGWKKFEDYDPSRPFDAWMFGIARNQIRYYLQKRKRDTLLFSQGTMDRLAKMSRMLNRIYANLMICMKSRLGEGALE